MSPIQWLQAYAYRAVELRIVAIWLHSKICFTSSAKRNLNVFGLINTEFRSRMHDGRLDKSVFVFQNLRQLDKLRDEDFVDPYLKDCPDLSDSDNSDDKH